RLDRSELRNGANSHRSRHATAVGARLTRCRRWANTSQFDAGTTCGKCHSAAITRKPMRKVALALVLICASACQTRALTPGELTRVTFEQHPGVQISPDLVFRDQDDRPFRLGNYIG